LGEKVPMPSGTNGSQLKAPDPDPDPDPAAAAGVVGGKGQRDELGIGKGKAKDGPDGPDGKGEPPPPPPPLLIDDRDSVKLTKIKLAAAEAEAEAESGVVSMSAEWSLQGEGGFGEQGGGWMHRPCSYSRTFYANVPGISPLRRGGTYPCIVSVYRSLS
jgi:hypothetical protein